MTELNYPTDSARSIANDLHDYLNVLLALVHAMDSIAFANAFRGVAANNLDCEASGYLAMLCQDHVEKMKDKVEALRYSVGSAAMPNCRPLTEPIEKLEAVND